MISVGEDPAALLVRIVARFFEGICASGSDDRNSDDEVGKGNHLGRMGCL